jgi:sugar lactone lactonase YvrE/DNA-binding IclR family transcriptional regulator
MDDQPNAGRRSDPPIAKPDRVAKADVPAGAAALAKGLTMLDMIADADRPLRFAEMLAQSDLSKPTFARILRTLVAFGLVRHDTEKANYALGPRFLEMSHRVWDTFDLQSAAGPELERLSAELGETVALCRLDDDALVYIDERSGSGLSVRIDPGRRAPLHCTAGGKALLAIQDPTFQRALIDRTKFDHFTENTILTKTAMVADLILTRARGYAVSFEEHLAGVNSVAVAVAGQDGVPVGALVVLGPSSRLDSAKIHPVGRELIAAARRITGSAGAIAISSRPRPRDGGRIAAKGLECVLPWGAQLGEAPIWHPVEQRLYWVDILHPAIYRFDPVTGLNETCDPGKLVSVVLPASNGRLIAATQDGLEYLDFATCKTTKLVDPEEALSENRLNDAKIGPGGSIWVGSMRLDASKASGGLFRVTADGTVTRKDSGVTVSNGLGWSPDQQTLYFVDTVPGHIYAYDFRTGTGELANKRIFASIADKDGRPDGLTVDAQGGVWCAIWDGWCLHRYLPDGTLDQVIDMPIPRPTSLTFGGDDLGTLFVTSARTRLPASTLSEAPLSGGIFAFRPGQFGLRTGEFGSKEF